VSGIKVIQVSVFLLLLVASNSTYTNAQDLKYPNVAGQFYPSNASELSAQIEQFLRQADPKNIDGEVLILLSPHAGYKYSGQTAAFGYKLIKNKSYKTVIVIAPSHRYAFAGISVYPKGAFRTPLGDVGVDQELAAKLLNSDKDIMFNPQAFAGEHSLEVQLPFLQKVLSDFKVIPVVMGDCDFNLCKKFARLLKAAIGNRKDILVIVSTDMYHGYDYQESEKTDRLTLEFIKNLDAEGLYNGIVNGKLELCGGFPAVTAMILARELGVNQAQVLKYTNSAQVTGKKNKGLWTVGYSSCAIYQKNKEAAMLNKEQRHKLLEIARDSIKTYLTSQYKLDIRETDPVLLKKLGAFVTLNSNGQLRGCIGNLIGNQPLYVTVRDMAIAAATEDPRFPSVELPELKNIEIEISVLSEMERVDSADKIILGTHGVLIRRGFKSGVFLPQVATETGWSKEEFLNNLCSHKAGLPQDAWKDKSTEIYIFSAEVFSEKKEE
jgi:AmmeMemoRadiSam system protein B/AmmeMemoRadiSam system protein A